MNEETLQLRSCADCKHRRTCCGVQPCDKYEYDYTAHHPLSQNGFEDRCRAIAEHYGYQKQRIQTIQELSELTCLLARRPDQCAKMDFRAELVGEIADVTIMLEQLRLMFGIEKAVLADVVRQKLQRQNARIRQEGESDNAKDRSAQNGTA